MLQLGPVSSDTGPLILACVSVRNWEPALLTIRGTPWIREQELQVSPSCTLRFEVGVHMPLARCLRSGPSTMAPPQVSLNDVVPFSTEL